MMRVGALFKRSLSLVSTNISCSYLCSINSPYNGPVRPAAGVSGVTRKTFESSQGNTSYDNHTKSPSVDISQPQQIISTILGSLLSNLPIMELEAALSQQLPHLTRTVSLRIQKRTPSSTMTMMTAIIS